MSDDNETELCPDPKCRRPVDSFGCKIRHIGFDTSWAKGDH